MASKQDQKQKSMADWKPGSEPEKAKEVGSSGDFGVPESGRSTVDRDYVSANTKVSDPGHAQPRAGASRTAGVGGLDSGPGSSSGGDIDTTFVGVGTGGSSLSQSGPGDERGADDTDGRNKFGPPAQGQNQSPPEQIGGNAAVPEASVAQSDESSDDPISRGSDAVTNPARNDDSFASEISRGEAGGQDN